MSEITNIAEIPGIYAASATSEDAGTGCTVIICPKGAVGGVDVRGGAPATRETDLLRPEETVGVLHAVVLSGGSAYGLAAACGVAEELERSEIGLDVGVVLVPIVSSACLFDLACGDGHVRPTSDFGVAAVRSALDNPKEPLDRGNVGAGAGCTVGKFAGPDRCMKSGLGQGVQSAGSLVCGAVSAVNAVGNIKDPSTGTYIAGVLDDKKGTVLSPDQFFQDMAKGAGEAKMPLRTNTTISCIATNAKLTKAQATKVAQMAADAYAHTIYPTHTTNDGDTIFVMATGEVEAPVDVVGVMATSALEKAILDAAWSAEGAYGHPSARDIA